MRNGRSASWWLPGLFAAIVGCGPSVDEDDEDDAEEAWEDDCDETCEKLYRESACNIQSPGWTRQDLVSTCRTACEAMFGEPGDVRAGFTPYQYTPADHAVELTNEAETRMWMDCIDEKPCELLEAGYCAPIW